MCFEWWFALNEISTILFKQDSMLPVILMPSGVYSDFNIPEELATSSFRLTHSWSRALLEKLPIVQLLENFPAFYGTRRFITAFT
jgi:hypothetical protein